MCSSKIRGCGKRPATLTKARLVEFIYCLQQIAFLDCADATADDDRMVWNPDKELGGADFVENVLELLRNFDLAPTAVEVAEGE